jgi:hypothetical protein
MAKAGPQPPGGRLPVPLASALAAEAAGAGAAGPKLPSLQSLWSPAFRCVGPAGGGLWGEALAR